MVTGAIAAIGCKLQIGATDIVEVTNISGPSLTLETVDVTNHSSTEAWKEYCATLLDMGEVTFDISYIPTTATHKNTAATGLIGILVSRVVAAFGIHWSDVGATEWTFNAFVTKFTPSAPVADKLSAAVTLKITGKYTALA